MRIKNWIVNLLFLLLCGQLYAQPEQLSEQAKVSVITCGTGDEMYSIFGHTALRFVDKEQQVDAVFNYGTFDFNTPNFYAKFIKGDLLYYLSVSDYSSFVWQYQADNRSVEEQFLDLTFAQKQQLWQMVLQQYRGPEKYYTYRFVHNNCTTKVVDLLNEVLSQPLSTDFEANNQSYRDILNSYVKDNYFEKLGINILFGRRTDELNQHIFMPDKLLKSVEISTNNSAPITQKTIPVFTATEKSPNMLNSWWFACVLSVATIFLSRFKIIRHLLLIFSGLIGILLVFIHFYSQHIELLNNNMVMLFNPLLIFYVFVKNKNLKKYFAFMLLSIIALFCIMSGLTKVFMFFPILGINIACILFEKEILRNNTCLSYLKASQD